MLTVIDEYSRECLAIEVDRHIRSGDVLHVLTDLFIWHGPPHYIRSYNSSKFTARAVWDWLLRVGVETLYIDDRLAVGERLQRELQRQAPGRAAEWGNLLQSDGGEGADREMAQSLQHHQAA